jgi:hypothetical protein
MWRKKNTSIWLAYKLNEQIWSDPPQAHYRHKSRQFCYLVTQSEEPGLFPLTKLTDFVLALLAECKKEVHLGLSGIVAKLQMNMVRPCTSRSITSHYAPGPPGTYRVCALVDQDSWSM